MDLNANGTYEYISADYVVAGVKMQMLMKEDDEAGILLLDYLKKGLKRLNSNSIFIPLVIQLPITNLRAKLPVGFQTFTSPFPVVFTDAEGTINNDNVYCAPRYNYSTFPGNSPFPARESPFNLTGTVDVIDGYLVFSNNVDAEYCCVSCIVSNVDEFGNIKIPAKAEDALAEFMMWMWKRADRRTYSESEIYDHKVLWQKGKKGLKAIYNLPNSVEQQFISSRINSMV